MKRVCKSHYLIFARLLGLLLNCFQGCFNRFSSGIGKKNLPSSPGFLHQHFGNLFGIILDKEVGNVFKTFHLTLLGFKYFFMGVTKCKNTYTAEGIQVSFSFCVVDSDPKGLVHFEIKFLIQVHSEHKSNSSLRHFTAVSSCSCGINTDILISDVVTILTFIEPFANAAKNLEATPDSVLMPSPTTEIFAKPVWVLIATSESASKISSYVD